MKTSTLIEFLTWATVVNVGVLMVTAIALMTMGGFASRIHSKMFGITEAEAKLLYFRWIASYKLLTLVFFVAPLVALLIIK